MKNLLLTIFIFFLGNITSSLAVTGDNLAVSSNQEILPGSLTISSSALEVFPNITQGNSGEVSILTFSSPVVITDLRNGTTEIAVNATSSHFVSGVHNFLVSNLRFTGGSLTQIGGLLPNQPIISSSVNFVNETTPINLLSSPVGVGIFGQWNFFPEFKITLSNNTLAGIYESDLVFTIL